MFRVRAVLVLLSVTGVMLISAPHLSAQICIGHTSYIIRDEKGTVMPISELKKLDLKVNGVDLIWNRSTPDGETIMYQSEQVLFFRNKLHRYLENGGELRNPIGFGIEPPAFCGMVEDLSIHYAGKKMRLIFGIGKHNTHYQIDSLPFQSGTFVLTSIKCSDGGPPPMIDNNTVGKCHVTADSWKTLDKDWEKRLVTDERWVLEKAGLDCGEEPLTVINTEKQLKELSDRFSGAVERDKHIVDFKTRVVLVRFLYGHIPGTDFGGLFINASGNVTIRGAEPRRGTPPPGSRCHAIFHVVSRSGLRTVEGKPVPAVSVSDLIPLGPNPFSQPWP